MRPHILTPLVALAFLALPFCAVARDQTVSSRAACRLLVRTGQKCHLAIEHPGVYYCGAAQRIGDYFVIDLRHTDETAPIDWMGSSLVGYYGVRARDGFIVEWNVVEEVPGKPVEARNQKPPNQPPMPAAPFMTFSKNP